MFNPIESWWNARTPKFLHNGTKENIIFQVIATVMLLVGMHARHRILERRWNKKYNMTHGN